VPGTRLRWHSRRLFNNDAGECATRLQERFEPGEEFIVGEVLLAGRDQGLGLREKLGINQRCECALVRNPHRGRIRDALLLEFEAHAVVDITTLIFAVGKDLVNRAVGPGSAKSVCTPSAFRSVAMDCSDR